MIKKSFLYITDLFRAYDGETSFLVIQGTFKPKGEQMPLEFKSKWYDMDEYQTIQNSLKVEGFWIDGDEVVAVLIKEHKDIAPVNLIAKNLAAIYFSVCDEVMRK